MEAIQNLIHPELLILIPVLHFIGVGLKRIKRFPDQYMAVVLGVIGIILATGHVAANRLPDGAQSVLALAFAGVTQGVLSAGCAAYVHQLGKKSGDDK